MPSVGTAVTRSIHLLRPEFLAVLSHDRAATQLDLMIPLRPLFHCGDSPEIVTADFAAIASERYYDDNPNCH